MYKKGTVIARDGSNTRCGSTGLENIYAGYDG